LAIQKQRVYLGEVWFEDGTYDLIGGPNESLSNEDDEWCWIGIEISEEKEHFVNAFRSYDEAVKQTQLAAQLRNSDRWKVTYLDIEHDPDKDPYDI
jgi:hypothetical protein